MKIKKCLPLLLIFALTFSCMFAVTAGAEAPDTALLLDDFDREELGGDPANGGAFGAVNSRGNTIYWINYNQETTFPEIVDGALKVEFKVPEGGEGEGWFGEGGSIKSEEGFNYIVIRMKGEVGGEESALSINPDANSPANFSDLKDPNGNPIKITAEWQDIIIDLKANGFRERLYVKGLEAVHFNASASATIYIDEIYLSKTADLANEPRWSGATAAPDEETVPVEEISIPEGTTTASPVTLAPFVELAANTIAPEQDNGGAESNVPLLAGIIGGAVLLTALVAYLFFVKKTSK